MGIELTSDEILAIAEQIERNGAAFYRKAAERVSDPDMQATLNWLAEEEESHEQTFIEMRQELKDKESALTPWDPDGQYEMYLQAIADGDVFNVQDDAAGAAEGFNAVRDILEFALDREKDSIVFYMVIVRKSEDATDKSRIQGILDEEIGHVAIITSKLVTL